MRTTMRHGDADAFEPWAVAAADYPAAGDAEERIRFRLGYAVLAPSGHNTQPSLFRIRREAVEFRAGRTVLSLWSTR